MNKEEKYKLMNKLLKQAFKNDKIETQESILTTKLIRDGHICTTSICLCIAIARKTRANLYITNNGITFYITHTKFNTLHYLSWANKHIKHQIEVQK